MFVFNNMHMLRLFIFACLVWNISIWYEVSKSSFSDRFGNQNTCVISSGFGAHRFWEFRMSFWRVVFLHTCLCRDHNLHYRGQCHQVIFGPRWQSVVEQFWGTEYVLISICCLFSFPPNQLLPAYFKLREIFRLAPQRYFQFCFVPCQLC